MGFHDLEKVATELKSIFDIDILHRMKPEDFDFAKLMFHRRHVYEHNGGEVDEDYLRKSGDQTVRLKQLLRETQQSAHKLVAIIEKMSRNLHEGFHEILPPYDRVIEAFSKRQEQPDH